ncbi:MAG: hypothetical protein ACH37Z_17415 [Anaerolineae bacterium]|nr:hypothetical protein [Ardenticatenia bacterium]MBK8541265.1 hypothetical protein [Ardenticatenia bacterium]HQZ71735.1 hypothetical protein [Anaerolineae bacterium]
MGLYAGAAALLLGALLLALGFRRRRFVDHRPWHVGSGRDPFLPPTRADDGQGDPGELPYMPGRRPRR